MKFTTHYRRCSLLSYAPLSTTISGMQPNQTQPGLVQPPAGAAPPPGQYDFIMNPNKPKKTFVSASSFKTRIIIAAGGGLALLIVALVLVSILGSSGSINTSALLVVGQKQNELARISQLPASNADQQQTQNFAATTRLTLLTDQQSLLNYLQARGVTIDPKSLELTMNLQTDSALKNAQTDGTYDQTYLSIAQSQLNSYAQALKQAYAGTSGHNERLLLQNEYNNVQLLLTLSGSQS